MGFLGIIGAIIIIGACLLAGYGMLLEYLTKKDMRPVYHIFIVIIIIVILSSTCSN